MRVLQKLDEPLVLQQNAANWTADYLRGLAADERPNPKWGHSEIRATLRNEVKSKCAYCEGYVEDVSYSEVEHIVPKSVKPDLVYAWHNLTGACRRCNGGKGDFFSEEDGLLNPYVDDVDAHLHFQGPLITSQLGSTRGEITIEKLKLNRFDLVMQRVRRIEAAKQVLERWNAAEEPHREILGDGLRLDAQEGEFSRVVITFLVSLGFQVP